MARLPRGYGAEPIDEAEVIVCLGGDGFMLETLHRLLDTSLQTPVYGMNCGSVGFLMNNFAEDDLPFRLCRAQAALLHPAADERRHRRGHGRGRRSRSTRSRCCASSARPPRSASPSTAASACRS